MKAESYRVTGKIIQNFAGKLEICDCHAELWQPKRSFQKRRKLMAKSLGDMSGEGCTCVWQGRRIPWFICVGWDELKSSLNTATFNLLQTLLGETQEPLRSQLLLNQTDMRRRVVDRLEDTFGYLLRCEHYGIGAYYCAQGGPCSQAREI